MINYPLTIQFEKESPSAIASIIDALDSPIVFYLVFVLPFMLLALVFSSNRKYTCVFGDEGITVRYKGIITQKIGRDRVRGMDAIAGDGAGALRIRWEKRMNESAQVLEIPGTGFRDLNMSMEDIAAALSEHYCAPAGYSRDHSYEQQ